MTKNEILKEAIDMANHNMYCYSKNLLMNEAKENYKNEWNKEKEKIDILESLIKEHETIIKRVNEYIDKFYVSLECKMWANAKYYYETFTTVILFLESTKIISVEECRSIESRIYIEDVQEVEQELHNILKN